MRYSGVFRLYEKIFKPSALLQHKKEVEFYRSFLSSPELIFDIGANDGHKTAAFLEIAKRIVCIEPDDENMRLLNIRFRKNKNVFTEKIAASDANGTATMHIHHATSAFNTLSPKWKELLEKQGQERWNETINFTATKEIKTRTLDDLILQYGKPGFIKIDVEGFEPWVLRGLSTTIDCISFESLLPEYKEECMECLRLINRLDTNATFNIAKEEKLLLPKFVDLEAIKNWIDSNNNANTIEVIVKMNSLLNN